MSYNSKIMLVSGLYEFFPRIMPAKLVIYNSQNYAGTLGSGLTKTTYIAKVMIITSSICLARVMSLHYSTYSVCCNEVLIF